MYDTSFLRFAPQYPGGLTLCDSLVHFGSSIKVLAHSGYPYDIIKPTVYSLAIFFLLSIENGVFVFGYHFLLTRHFVLPSFHSLRSNALFGQCLIYSCYNRIDSS